MCDFQLCRICLRNESKFYKLDEYQLKTYYEEITTLPVQNKDGLPQYFCYECAGLLYKFHGFRDRCLNGQKVLRDMLASGPLTYAGISELNVKKIHKCQNGILNIISINKRVKTCNIQEQVKIEKNEDIKKEETNTDYNDSRFSDDDSFTYDDPVTDPVGLEPTLVVEVKIENDKDKEVFTEPIISNTFTINEVGLNFDKNNVKDEKTKVTKGKRKPAKKTKPKPKPKPKQTKKKVNTRRKKPRSESSDSDSSEEVLAKTKAKKKVAVVSEDTEKRSYKFEEPKTKVRNLAFLDSGFWTKTSLSEEEAVKNFEARAQEKKYLNAAYKCTRCYKGFSQQSMLDRHIPQRHSDAAGKAECRFCKHRFKSAYFLNKHMKQHYTKYQCLRCNLVCSLDNTALFHEEYHNGVVRKCPHCNKEFRHLSTFYTHLRTHRSKHMCSLCGESFVSELGLRLHRKAKHETDIAQTAAQKPPEGSTYCDVCSMKFETKEAYKKHLAHSDMHTDTNKGGLIDDDLFINIFDDEPKPADAEEKAEAEELHKSLYHRRSRVEKQLSAVRKSLFPRKTTKKPTSCYHCHQHFESQTACMKHHLAMHPGTSFFSPRERVICEICGASLAPGSVPSHLNQHTRSKMYTCDTCGRSFTTSTMLRTHLVTHTGEKKYGCNLCEKRFTQNGSLSLHYRTFHLKQPYPQRNRKKKIEEDFNGKEE